MAAFDFPPNAGHPAAPTVGEKWPVPPVAGKPVYTWDGEKWTTFGGTTGTIDAADEMPLPDATPGSIGSSLDYAREDHVHPADPAIATIADKVNRNGDTLTGPLIAAADPTAALGIATKQYVVAKAGDTLTGPLIAAADPVDALGVATKQYVDLQTRQRVSLAGGKSFDVAVPASAKGVRMAGFILPTSATTFQPVIQVSLAPGVFLTTAGDYQFSGFQHSSNSTPTAVAGSHSNTTIQGMYLGLQTHAFIGLSFDGYLSLTRPGTSNSFQSETRCSTYNASGSTHYFHLNMVQTASSGSALSILALRFATHAGAGDIWGANSFVTLEWM